MSGLQKIYAALQYLSVVIDISDILEFNKKAKERYRSRNTEVCVLIKEGHTYHVNFLRFLILVKNKCNGSCAALNNLKMELEIAIETQEFDNTFLAEIQEASQDLTNTFETLYGNTKDIKKNLFEFSQELQSEKKLIKSDVDTSNNVALIKTIAIVFRTCASISSLMVFETAGEMSAIIGSAVVGGLLVDDQENKSRKSEKLIMVTDNISDQNSELYGSVDTLSEKVYGIKEDIHIFLDGARKTVQQGTNRLVVSENGGPQAVNGPNVGNRLVIKARGMIEGINDLLSQLRGLEVYTTGYSVELRAKIRRESPRSLITL